MTPVVTCTNNKRKVNSVFGTTSKIDYDFRPASKQSQTYEYYVRCKNVCCLVQNTVTVETLIRAEQQMTCDIKSPTVRLNLKTNFTRVVYLAQGSHVTSGRRGMSLF